MDNVDIYNEHKQLVKAGVPFLRAPVAGEWVQAPGGPMVPVTSVAHVWSGTTPRILIQIDTSHHGMAAAASGGSF